MTNPLSCLGLEPHRVKSGLRPILLSWVAIDEAGKWAFADLSRQCVEEKSMLTRPVPEAQLPSSLVY